MSTDEMYDWLYSHEEESGSEEAMGVFVKTIATDDTISHEVKAEVAKMLNESLPDGMQVVWCDNCSGFAALDDDGITNCGCEVEEYDERTGVITWA